MIFANAKAITIPEGAVKRILFGDNVLWAKSGLPALEWMLGKTYSSSTGELGNGFRAVTDIFDISSDKNVRFSVLSCKFAVSCYDADGEYLGQMGADELFIGSAQWWSAGTVMTYAELLAVNPSIAKIAIIASSDDEVPEFMMEYTITFIECIETNGTQCIDTGFVPDNNTRVVMDYVSTDQSSNRLFGARASTSSKNFTFLTSSSGALRFGRVMSRQKKEMSQIIFNLETACFYFITHQSLHFVL